MSSVQFWAPVRTLQAAAKYVIAVVVALCALTSAANFALHADAFEPGNARNDYFRQ